MTVGMVDMHYVSLWAGRLACWTAPLLWRSVGLAANQGHTCTTTHCPWGHRRPHLGHHVRLWQGKSGYMWTSWDYYPTWTPPMAHPLGASATRITLTSYTDPNMNCPMKNQIMSHCPHHFYILPFWYQFRIISWHQYDIACSWPEAAARVLEPSLVLVYNAIYILKLSKMICIVQMFVLICIVQMFVLMMYYIPLELYSHVNVWQWVEHKYCEAAEVLVFW